MQSGITASQTLHTAFQTFLTSPSSFALLITITAEKLEPLTTIPLSSSTTNQNNNNNNNNTTLPDLPSHLPPNTPLYIIIRRPTNQSTTAPQLTAITYVPPSSPVRQKTLFASTRLSLVRELGSERFSEQIFATEIQEVVEAASGSNEGEREGRGALTEGERVLEDVRRREEEEVEEGRGGGMGMGGRRLVQAGGGVGGEGGHGMKIVMGEGVVEELRGLGKGEIEMGRCVMLKILPDESIALAGVVADTDAANLASVISDTEPRYTFFSYRRNTTTTGGQEGAGAGSVVFIYTCPSGSKIKERMVYASMRMAVLEMVGREGGVVVGRKIEASNPAEITAELVAEEVEEVKPEVKQGFARPKRPGKR